MTFNSENEVMNFLSKPVPPANLWEQMDALVMVSFKPPIASFSSKDFCDRYGVSKYIASRKLSSLVKQGKLKSVRVGRAVWYSPVESNLEPTITGKR